MPTGLVEDIVVSSSSEMVVVDDLLMRTSPPPGGPTPVAEALRRALAQAVDTDDAHGCLPDAPSSQDPLRLNASDPDWTRTQL